MKAQTKTKPAQAERVKVVFDGDLVDVAQLYRDIEKYAPAELLDELSAIGDTLEQMSWRCGWKTDELYRTLEANGHKQNYLAVCYYVAATRLRSNRSANTVKAWALTARFYSPKVARKYGNDFLPFAIFTYAASFGEEAWSGEEWSSPFLNDTKIKYMWQAVLTYALGSYYESGYGKAPTLEKLKEVFEEAKPVKVNGNGSKSFSRLTPTPDMAIEPMQDEGETTEPFIIQAFSQALHVVVNSLPAIGRRFPKISEALSGISLQLAKVAEALENGVDLDDEE
jgi:hypothetical protein